MNLVIDFGNTRIKAALFQGDLLAERWVLNDTGQLIGMLPELRHVKNCLVCSVTDAHMQVSGLFAHHFNVMIFRPDTKVPVKNLYRSALTLGSDRLAAAVGAWSQHPSQNVLTIDAGTCIKYNFVNDRDQYLGGAISPGIPMRLKAMNSSTHALPLAEVGQHEELLIGRTTAESLLSGAVIGAACEADGMIDRYRDHYPNLQVVLTGGDASHLAGRLKNRFFANQNILLQGLNTILKHNIEA